MATPMAFAQQQRQKKIQENSAKQDAKENLARPWFTGQGIDTRLLLKRATMRFRPQPKNRPPARYPAPNQRNQRQGRGPPLPKVLQLDDLPPRAKQRGSVLFPAVRARLRAVSFIGRPSLRKVTNQTRKKKNNNKKTNLSPRKHKKTPRKKKKPERSYRIFQPESRQQRRGPPSSHYGGASNNAGQMNFGGGFGQFDDGYSGYGQGGGSFSTSDNSMGFGQQGFPGYGQGGGSFNTSDNSMGFGQQGNSAYGGFSEYGDAAGFSQYDNGFSQGGGFPQGNGTGFPQYMDGGMSQYNNDNNSYIGGGYAQQQYSEYDEERYDGQGYDNEYSQYNGGGFGEAPRFGPNNAPPPPLMVPDDNFQSPPPKPRGGFLSRLSFFPYRSQRDQDTYARQRALSNLRRPNFMGGFERPSFFFPTLKQKEKEKRDREELEEDLRHPLYDAVF